MFSDDIVRAVDRAARFSRNIGIVRFSSTFLPNISTLSQIFNARIIDLPIMAVDEASIRIQEAIGEGIGVFVGGVTGVKAARGLGYPAVLIESSGSSLYTALSEAASLVAKTAKLQRTVQLLRDALDLTGDAVIVADEEGQVLELSRAAVRAAGSDRERMLGQSIGSIAGGQASVSHTSMIGGECLGSVLILPRTAPPARQTSGAAITFDDIAGSSQCIRECVHVASRYARSDFSVLLTGETGTGKELFARSIHNASPRRDGPFVMVNCAALPESLLESELFGYASGSFTGANKGGKVGLFEQAQGGSIFLDEVSAMPVSVQQRFLRVLEDRCVRRVGDHQVLPLDIRVIAATNRDIRSLVASAAFLPDLFYRLNVLRLTLPPLREREEDVPAIAQRMLHDFSRSATSGPRGFTNAALASLMHYDWPGNVRELRNVIQRLVVCSDSDLVSAAEVKHAIGLDDGADEFGRVFSHFNQSVGYVETFPDGGSDLTAQLPEEPGRLYDVRNLRLRTRDHELDSILNALEACGGSKSLAAQRLGISRVTLWRKLKDHVASIDH